MRAILLSLSLVVANSAWAFPGGQPFKGHRAVARAPTISTFSGTSPVMNGVTSTLTIATDAATCSIDQGVGAVSCSGTASVSPSSTTTYTLTATSAKGKTSTAMATVTVNGMLREPASGVAEHLWADGSALRSSRAIAWEMVGTVPQVAAAAPVPASVGPFTDANYYRVNNALHFNAGATDFYIVYVFNRVNSTGSTGIGHDGEYNTRGIHYIQQTAWLYGAGVRSNTTAASPTDGKINVVCVGSAATAAVMQLNKGTLLVGAATTPVPGTGYSYLGKRKDASNYLNGYLYEALYVSGTTLTKAICDAHADQVQAVVGAGNTAY